MVTKRISLSLALLAILGACSKSPDDPIVPSPRSVEPQTGISLNGEIEFSDVPPQLTLIQIKNRLNLLVDFSIGGYTEDIEDEGDWDSILD